MNSDEIKNYFIKLAHENKLSHAYLVETNDLEKCSLDIRNIIKIINCPNTYQEKCDLCNLCHLIDTNSLPSFIEIVPEGKMIKKDAINSLKTTFSMTPIYSKFNSYIIISPEMMNSTSFNKLLKFLEEPEDGIIGFLVTTNKDYVAKTIVSRCEILRMNYDCEDEDNEYKKVASNIIADLQQKINLLDILNKYSLETFDRSSLINIFKEIFAYFLKELNSSNFNDLIYKKIEITQKYLEELNFNVNISLLIYSYFIEMGDVYANL